MQRTGLTSTPQGSGFKVQGLGFRVSGFRINLFLFGYLRGSGYVSRCAVPFGQGAGLRRVTSSHGARPVH